MKGRRPPFWNNDTQIRRATQASMARKKRLAAALIPPEPPPSPADAPQPAAEAMPVGRTVGMMEAVTEAWAARRMALYEQPSQRLPLLSGGVQDPPTTTSTRTEPAAGQFKMGPGVLDTPTAGCESPPIIPPNDRGTPGSPPPNPGPGRGGAALSAVGGLTVAHTAALPGAAVQSAVGGFNAQATTLQPSGSLTIRPTIYPTPPGDTVTVEDPVSINVHSAEFRDFVASLDRLTEAIQQSNEISVETRQQMMAELKAGGEYLKASKPSRKVVTLLLVVPLTAVATLAANTVVQEAAKLAFKALLKLIGPDVDIPV